MIRVGGCKLRQYARRRWPRHRLLHRAIHDLASAPLHTIDRSAAAGRRRTPNDTGITARWLRMSMTKHFRSVLPRTRCASAQHRPKIVGHRHDDGAGNSSDDEAVSNQRGWRLRAQSYARGCGGRPPCRCAHRRPATPWAGADSARDPFPGSDARPGETIDIRGGLAPWSPPTPTASTNWPSPWTCC
jgi:hypothetical protein